LAQATTNLTGGELRLVDANLNRLREGIRVVEDICRFVLDDSVLTKKLKYIRHQAKTSLLLEALRQRDIIGDCSKDTTKSEASRGDLNTVLIANFKRAEESSRVLEEILKLHDPTEAELFKSVRYAIYDAEKELFERIAVTASNSK
jgi:ThiD2 family